MGIIAPREKRQENRYTGSKRALAEAMSYAANEYIESPVTGEKVTKWQAVVDRLYNTAVYAESDKDATSAAKVIAERLFGRAPVQKQEKMTEIPVVVLAPREGEIKAIQDKAARAETDEDDAEDITPINITLESGEEITV